MIFQQRMKFEQVLYAPNYEMLIPHSALEFSNAECGINPDKIFDFRQPKTQNTHLRILGSINMLAFFVKALNILEIWVKFILFSF